MVMMMVGSHGDSKKRESMIVMYFVAVEWRVSLVEKEEGGGRRIMLMIYLVGKEPLSRRQLWPYH